MPFNKIKSSKSERTARRHAGNIERVKKKKQMAAAKVVRSCPSHGGHLLFL